MDQQLIQTVTERANIWLGNEYDAETRAAVQELLNKEDKTDLIECFYRDLEFGTGGLRGIMGAGTNRMNIYTVGAATQGLSNYLNKCFADLPQISVVIGYDCRNNSRKFAEISADIFSANGIKAYLFEDLRPTPEVSFAIRKFGCQSGIILTASHNPKEYNGYKAYWNDGAQIITPHDTNIIDEVNLVKTTDIKFKGNMDLIQVIGKDVDEDFISQIKTISLSPDAIRRHHDLKIVYTPIHGTGVEIIPACLRSFGFNNIIPVPEQNVVSGNFPTVVSPNPEEPAALSMAIEKAKETDADIVMASDPDADRMGIAIKNDRGEWILVNGNQTALIFIYYIITCWKKSGKLTGNEYLVKTIVTTELIKTIADKNQMELFDCFTGFKWIAAVIHDQELLGKKYLGGGEESYGFLAEDFVRDKDAVSSCALMAEIAAWAKDQNKTLYQMLCDIYVEYGFSKEKGVSVVKKGKSGAEEIQQMMVDFSANPPKEIAGSPVVLIKDFNTLEAIEPLTGKKYALEMPTTSNVLQYFSEEGSKVSIRPSGTEPKIKFYIEVRGEMKARGEYDMASEAADVKVQEVMKSLGL